MNVRKSEMELTGNTPLLEMVNYEREHQLATKIYTKLEYLSPAGSVKDRAALYMIEDAEERGILKPGATITEPTSRSTGIGLVSIMAMKGYKALLVMLEAMSMERGMTLKACGAELVLAEGAKGMTGAIVRAEELQKEIPGSMVLGQLVDPANTKAHQETTGPEVWWDTDGQVGTFIAGIGSGETITGVGEYLKSQKPEVKIVAVEPTGSPYLSKGTAGPHGIQGIGASFVPEILNQDIYDEIITVANEDAYDTGRQMATKEGILVDISSGAALWAATEFAKRPENAGKHIVVLLPDTGDRYLSTPMFAAKGKN